MKKLLLAVAGVLCVAATAHAVTPVRSIGFDVGYINPDIEDVDGTWTAGVFMDFGLGSSNLQLSPFVNYWTLSDDYLATDGFELYSVSESLRDVSLGLNLKYAFPTASTAFQPFVGGGVGIHMVNASVEIDSPSIYLEGEESQTEVGFQGGLGFRTAIGANASMVTSAWYNVLEIDELGVDHWSFRVGFAWGI